IYGSNFATATRSVANADLVNSVLPTSLGGVSVQINGKAAFVQYVSPGQVNVLAPDDNSSGSVSVTVKNAAGVSSPVSANIATYLPGLSALSNYVRAVRYPDAAIVNGTGNAETGYTTTPAVGPGDVVAIYGTGFGPVSSAPAIGTVFSGAYETTTPVTVTIGGIAAEVLWAGLVGSGLYQINVRVPAALTDGDQPVIARVGGLSSQTTGANLKVAAAA